MQKRLKMQGRKYLLAAQACMLNLSCTLELPGIYVNAKERDLTKKRTWRQRILHSPQS